MSTRDNAKADNIQLQNGERMDASKLNDAQIDYICTEFLIPQLIRAQAMNDKSEPNSIYGVTSAREIQKLSDIFISTGYWKERGNQ
jgi:hypothetical protein